MLNKTVFHKSFGKGAIISQETTADNKVYITVDFGDRKSIFPFPDTFKTFLTTEEEELKEIINNAFENQETDEGLSDDPIVDPPIETSTGKECQERTVYAQTNAEFLNLEFGTNYEKWYKSTWEYSYNTVVWMGFVDGKERDSWINFWSDKDHTVMIEEYNGVDGAIAERAIKYPFRIVAEKDFSSYTHKYYVRGRFRYDAKSSTTYQHVWRKVV
jgi:hypothetical protein